MGNRSVACRKILHHEQESKVVALRLSGTESSNNAARAADAPRSLLRSRARSGPLCPKFPANQTVGRRDVADGAMKAVLVLAFRPAPTPVCRRFSASTCKRKAPHMIDRRL
jgi:hypothetical protein